MSRKGSNGLATLAVFGAGVGAWLWWDASRGKRSAGDTSEITNAVASTVRSLVPGLLPGTTANNKIAATKTIAVKPNNGVVGAPAPIFSFDGVTLPPAILGTVNEVEERTNWLGDPQGYFAPEVPSTFAEAVEKARETGSTAGTHVPGMSQAEMLAVFRASMGMDQ